MTVELTKEQVQELQDKIDEQTIFALAVLMMEIHTGTLMKNKALVANSFMKAQVILRNNPGFPDRFKAAQSSVIEQLKSMQRGQVEASLTTLSSGLAANV